MTSFQESSGPIVLGGKSGPASQAYQPLTNSTTSQQVYQFKGALAGANGYTFNVLAGYAPPQITGGWPIINVIDRPLRLGFTLPTGYDPLAVDIPIQFESVVQAVSADVEHDIQKLEWMAGRGKLYGTDNGGSQLAPATGLPPLVNIQSVDSNNVQTSLIPLNLQDLTWVITNIVHDNTVGVSSSGGQQQSAGVMLDRTGNRVRQATVVSLMQYVAAPGAVNSPAARQKQRQGTSGFKTFQASQRYQTIQAIVQNAMGSNATSTQIQTVVQFNLSRLHGTSALKPLKTGTKVEIPNSVLSSIS